ncbi:MAG: DUF4338 domain-containing protein [Desulfovibrio sp.]|nr:DUF4338 domain-containing protein [Desulfovibrio sp.]
MLLDTNKATKTASLVDAITNRLEFYKALSSREYTFAKKFEEIQANKNKYSQSDLDSVKAMIFNPEDPSDVMNIKPKLIYVDSTNKSGMKTFQILRTFCTAHENVNRIGRALRYLVIDEATNKYLGIIHVCSDMALLSKRNKYLGIDKQINARDWECLKNIASCYTLVPMQPFGFNYAGGKLITLLAGSEVIEQDWNRKYKEKLVGLSTTSLYGSFSQYTNLKHWKKTGELQSQVSYKLPDNEYELAKDWLNDIEPEKHFDFFERKHASGKGPYIRDNKNKFHQYVFKKLGFKKTDYECSHARGTFFCSLFNESPEFLQGNINYEKLTRRYDNSVESLTAMWKERYAKKRLEKLEQSGNLKSEILFYDGMLNAENWNKAKTLYLNW